VQVQLQIATKPSIPRCHLANTNEKLTKLATAIPSFAVIICLFCYSGSRYGYGNI